MSSESLIGQTLGNYRIISRIGRGGMATVYRARQTTMGRDVAIKVMRSDLTEDPQYEARFEREAQVIANLQHPRVLPVHDFGHEGEMFYLVMRLIEGESLYQRLLKGPLPLKQIARYVNQMAEALDYAHSQGVIHRDLKPNNVMLDELDNLYLMDFGLAKMLAATQSLTQTGTVIGTPQYMAPEQWRGAAIDARTDVYSLGAMIYEMTVGRPPFASDTPFTLMYKHVNDAPPPPRDSLPDLPEAVEAVILRALAKEPADRFQSAGDLARDLTGAVREANIEGAADLVPPPVVAGNTIPAETDTAPPGEAVVVEQEPAPPAESIPDTAEAPAKRDEAQEGVAVYARQTPPPQVEDDVVPPPGKIAPPPPPIPVPGGQQVIHGAPDPGARPVHAAPLRSSVRMVRPTDDVPEPPASAIRRAFDKVDRGLDSAFEKAAHKAPPFTGPASEPEMRMVAGAQFGPDGVPVSGPAINTMRGLLDEGESLLGVLDMRGTDQWGLWKQMLVGGLALNVLGGILGVGVFNMLGWVAWIFLAVQMFRTWRGDIGRYYLGFTSEGILILPRDRDNAPEYDKAVGAHWAIVERLRLSDRYVLLDIPDGDGGTTQIGALLVAEGEGGLGPQQTWLPNSAIPKLLTEQGFELRNM